MTDLSKQHIAYGWSPCDQGYDEYFGGSNPELSYFNPLSFLDVFKKKVAPSVDKASDLLNKINTGINGNSGVSTPVVTETEAADPMRGKKKMIVIACAVVALLVLILVVVFVLKKKKS
jgi:hypothetical protein